MIDSSALLKSVETAEREVIKADRETVTDNARSYLKGVVWSLPERTGNLRSAAIPVWRKLNIPGRPPTLLNPGVKIASWREGSRIRQGKFSSNGTFEDRRSYLNPSFSYWLYAAEWRGRHRESRSAGAFKAAVDRGLFGADDLKKIVRMFESGVSYAEVWDLISDLLSSTGRGRTFLLNKGLSGGMWKPYSIHYKGNRKKVTARTRTFRFSPSYKRALEGR